MFILFVLRPSLVFIDFWKEFVAKVRNPPGGPGIIRETYLLDL